MSKYLLMDMDSGRDSMGSGDKLVILKAGTNSEGSVAIDVSKEFRDGAKVFVAQFKPVTVASGTATVSSAVVTSGETLTMILGNSNDLQFDGGIM